MNKYMKYLIIFALGMSINPALAQETDQRLIDYKGLETINQLAEENPEELEYLEFVLNNIFVIQDLGFKGESNFPHISTIEKLNPEAPEISSSMNEEDINPFYYNFHNSNKQKIYSLGEGKVLIVRSQQGLQEHFEEGKEYMPTN